MRRLRGGLKVRKWSLSLVIKTPLRLPVRCELYCMNGVRREVNVEPNCCFSKLWQEVSAHFEKPNYMSSGRGLRHSSLLSELHRRSLLCLLQRCVEDTPGRKLSWQLCHVCHFHYSLNVNYFSSENPQCLQIQLCDRHEDATASVSLSLGETNSVGGMMYIVLILCGLKNKTTWTLFLRYHSPDVHLSS